MSAFLDPFYSFLLFLAALIVGGAVVGVVAAELLTTLSVVILLWLLGVLVGQYYAGTHAEIVGTVVAAGLFAWVAAQFLPFDVVVSLAVFFLGFLYGRGVHRHGGGH